MFLHSKDNTPAQMKTELDVVYEDFVHQSVTVKNRQLNLIIVLPAWLIQRSELLETATTTYSKTLPNGTGRRDATVELRLKI